MQENRFFRFVWRVNGLAILLLVVSVIVIGGYELITSLIGQKKPPIIKNITDDPSNKEGWHLGNVNEISGSQYLFIPLVSENKNIEPGKAYVPSASRSESWSGYYGPSRNIVFINSSTMEMKWLFEGNSQLITSVDLLGVRPYDPKNKPRAIIYQVVKTDSNHNNILDQGDLANIAISDISGGGYKEIVSVADRLIGAKLAGENKIVVFYQVHGIGYAVSISLDTLVISKPVEIPKVSQSS